MLTWKKSAHKFVLLIERFLLKFLCYKRETVFLNLFQWDTSFLFQF